MYSLCRFVFCLSQTIIRNTKFPNWLFLGFGDILVLLFFLIEIYTYNNNDSCIIINADLKNRFLFGKEVYVIQLITSQFM